MSLFLVCNYNYPHCQYCTYHSNVNEDPLSICLMEWTIYHPQWCTFCPFHSRIKLRKWHLAHKLQRIVKLQKLIFSLWKCHFSEIIPKFFFWFRSTSEEMSHRHQCKLYFRKNLHIMRSCGQQMKWKEKHCHNLQWQNLLFPFRLILIISLDIKLAWLFTF